MGTIGQTAYNGRGIDVKLNTLPVVTYPDPMLREVCVPCDPSDKSLKKLARQMANTMYANNGCGLAAPQVGVNKRIIVIDCDQDSGTRNPITLLNPEIIETRGPEELDGEGCLSCPGITVEVRRPTYAIVKYTDLNGEDWIIEGDGLLGRCLQHEIDHLNGITLFESCDMNARIKALKDYKAAQQAGAKPGDTSVE